MRTTDELAASHRTRAVHVALAAAGTLGAELLARHPEAESLGRPEALEALDWIQWDEVEHLLRLAGLNEERLLAGASRSPETFFALRREAQDELDRRRVASGLPSRWGALARRSATEIRAVSARVGLELAAHAAARVPAPELGKWAYPLGPGLARDVLDLVVRRSPDAAGPLARAAASAFAEEAVDATRERLLARLGRRALALDFHSFGQEVRHAIARSGRSTLFSVLERTRPLAGAEAELAELVPKLIDRVLGEGDER